MVDASQTIVYLDEVDTGGTVPANLISHGKLHSIAGEALATADDRAVVTLLLKQLVTHIDAATAAMVVQDTPAEGRHDVLAHYGPCQQVDCAHFSQGISARVPQSTEAPSVPKGHHAAEIREGSLAWMLPGRHGPPLTLVLMVSSPFPVDESLSTLVDWIALAADRLFAAAPASPNVDREAVHRLSNALGVITMHADLGSLLTEQADESHLNELFVKISQQGQACAEALRALLHCHEHPSD